MNRYLLLIYIAIGLHACQNPETIITELDYNAEEYVSMSDDVSVTDAIQFNNFFTRYGNGWTGGDATYSCLLPDGRTVWMFGDSFLDTVHADRSRPPSGLVRNVFMIQKGKKFKTLVSGSIDEPEAFVNTPDPDNAWYWPGDATVIDDNLFVFMEYFIRTGAGAWDFEYQRTDLVKFSLPDLSEVSRTTVWEGGDVIFGAAILEWEDYIYIYGAESFSFTKYAHLARVPADNIYAAWEYFNGVSWQDTFPEDEGRLVKANGFPVDVSAQYSVVYLDGKFNLLTQEGFLGPKIHSYFSTSPTGPWKKKTLVYETPDFDGDVWTYNAFMHPQFINPATGAILVSYNTNAANFFDLFSNADYYRPYFIWVKFL
ncbi:MAG TPA: DUF5005 domain-containing protein [Chitinophagales bacterium]|nr:DUF5005 domain-containing protein [Chitinophagales bacterium]